VPSTVQECLHVLVHYENNSLQAAYLVQTFTVGGFTVRIQQPALDGEETFACDARLKLSDAQHKGLGERAAKLTAALRITGVLHAERELSSSCNVLSGL
jgi:hypothetical protein